MHPLLRIFFTGMLVSFLGSLPLGTLNIASMQISITEGINSAFLFVLGTLTAEIVYVRLSLVAMDWITRQEKLFRILEWITLVIVLALAFFSFYAASHPRVGENIVLSSTFPKYILGLTMSAVNPVQIPFWFGWSTILFAKKILKPRSDHYNAYIVGIGVGTFIGNCIFIFGGLLLVEKLNTNQHLLNWIIGGIFTLTALIQLWRILKKKDPAHQVENPEDTIPEFEKKLVDKQNP